MATLKDLAERIKSYFNPTSNAGQNFWSTPVAQTLANIQSAPRNVYNTVVRAEGINPQTSYIEQVRQARNLSLGALAKLPEQAKQAWLEGGLIKNNPIIPQKLKTPLANLTTYGPGQLMAGWARGLGAVGNTRQPVIERAGNLLGAVGQTLFPGETYGMAGFSAGINALAKSTDTPTAYGEGFEMGAKLGPISRVTEFLLNPILNKLGMKALTEVNRYWDLAKKATTAEIRNKFITLGVKRILQNVPRQVIAGGLGFGAYGATTPAKDIEERLTNVVNNAIQGGVFSGAMAIAGPAVSTLGKQVVGPLLRGEMRFPTGLSVRRLTKEEHYKNLVSNQSPQISAPTPPLSPTGRVSPLQARKGVSPTAPQAGLYNTPQIREIKAKLDKLGNSKEFQDFYKGGKISGKSWNEYQRLSREYRNLLDKGGVSQQPLGEVTTKLQKTPRVRGGALPLKISEAKPTKPIRISPSEVGAGQPNGLGSPSSPSIIPDDKSLIDQLNKALKEAKPIRGTQEEMYTKARGEKLARMLSAREKMAGEKGFYQELGTLKGELPRAEYEPIRSNFDQPTVDRLFNMIKESNKLDDWDKINAQVGLSKILGEKGTVVPTRNEIEKMYAVFGEDFTKTLLDKRPLFEKLAQLGMQIYNLPRSIMAGAGDLSATLMQNLMFAYRHPILTGKNFVKEVGMFFNKDVFNASQNEIYSRPNSDLYKQAKLSLTDIGPVVSQREEMFMSNLAEKIPLLGRVIKASGRAYTGFLNRMRADTFDQLVETQKILGENPNSPEFLKWAGTFVNAATGRGNLGKLERSANILGQGFFSARKLVATKDMLNPQMYIIAPKAIRQEALKTILSFIGGGMTILGLAKLAGAEVGEEPTSTDFGKIKVGNTRFNIWGSYQQIAVLMARLWKGYATSSTTGKKMMLGDESNPYAPTRLDLITRFFESKEHPTLSLILGALRGTNQIGQPFNLATETLNRFIPMVLADGYDLYKEHGSKGLLGILPAMLGIPVQTYGTNVPSIKVSSSGTPSIKLTPVGGLAEDIWAKITNAPVSNIPREQWPIYIQAKEKQTQERIQTDEAKATLKSGKLDSNLQQFNYGGYTGYLVGQKFIYVDETGAIKTKTIKETETKPTSKVKGAKKPKKITIKKVSVPKPAKITKSKAIKITTIKVPKPPSIKSPRSYKAIKITAGGPLKTKQYKIKKFKNTLTQGFTKLA